MAVNGLHGAGTPSPGPHLQFGSVRAMVPCGIPVATNSLFFVQPAMKMITAIQRLVLFPPQDPPQAHVRPGVLEGTEEQEPER